MQNLKYLHTHISEEHVLLRTPNDHDTNHESGLVFEY